MIKKDSIGAVVTSIGKYIIKNTSNESTLSVTVYWEYNSLYESSPWIQYEARNQLGNNVSFGSAAEPLQFDSVQIDIEEKNVMVSFEIM